MGLETMRVLYKHRLELNKPVDDILKRYPELKDDVLTEETEKVAPKGSESPQKTKEKKSGKKSKR